MYTEEKIKSLSTEELMELIQSVNYDRLGGYDGEFYIRLNPFSDPYQFESLFFKVTKEVVIEYLCRLLVAGYQSNPEYSMP